MSSDLNRLKHLEYLAEKLGKAWFDCSLIEGPSPLELPKNNEEAYFIQDCMAKVIGKALSEWKAGAISAKMRELDDHDNFIPARKFQSVTFIGSTHRLPNKSIS